MYLSAVGVRTALKLEIAAEAIPEPVPEPIDAPEFADLMGRFGPFESRARVAVGVSGGPDSLALTLLADGWARARGGQAIGLIVDHGLRAASAQEAAQVAAWLSARGIAHCVLRWEGPKPRSSLQATAREKRRALLVDWCRTQGILHLLLGHHRGDQAETWLMRRERSSGPAGLAAMAAAVELPDLRLLRPLLDAPAPRLRATLRARAQRWIDDPSNDDTRFTRVRLRATLADGTLDAAAIATAAREAARARRAGEAERAAELARAAAIHPEGWVRLDGEALRLRALSPGALAQVLMAVGGGAYPPRRKRLERLYAALVEPNFAGATLAGCRLLPWRGDVLVTREHAAIGGALPIVRPGRYVWDARFDLTIASRRPIPPDAYQIARLGPLGWRQVAVAGRELGASLPGPVRASLPALWDLDGVREVPHLLYRRRGADPDSVAIVSAMFRPRQILAGPGFFAL